MIIVDVNSSQIQALLQTVSAQLSEKVAAAAVNKTAATLKRMMISEASSAGFGQLAQKHSASGWSWETLGRMPRAIQTSKFFRARTTKSAVINKGDKGKKIFITRSRGKPFTSRMPHAHLLISGHRQFVPTGLPGKGQVRLSRTKPFEPARPVFIRSPLAAQKLLVHQLEIELRRVIKTGAKP